MRVSETAARHTEQMERHHRLPVIRDDLRQRKAQHMERVLKWRRDMRDYDEYRKRRELFEEARLLMAGFAGPPPKAAKAEAADGEEEEEEEEEEEDDEEDEEDEEAARFKKKPSRPVFCIFGPPGHFNTLIVKVAIHKEEEKKRHDREWAERDKANMAAFKHDLEAKEAAKPALLRKNTSRIR